MKRFILAALLAALAVPLYGQTVRERVDLPTADQSQMFWSTLVTTGSDESIHLQSMFRSDPVLQRLLKETRYRPRSSSDAFYRTRLQAAVGTAPLFMLQCPDGGVVYKCTKGNIPATSKQLLAGIKRELAKFRCHPQPKPTPTPTPTPTPELTPLVPDTEPLEPEGGSSLLLNAILVALGLGGGAAGKYFTRRG